MKTRLSCLALALSMAAGTVSAQSARKHLEARPQLTVDSLERLPSKLGVLNWVPAEVRWNGQTGVGRGVCGRASEAAGVDPGILLCPDSKGSLRIASPPPVDSEMLAPGTPSGRGLKGGKPTDLGDPKR